MHTIGIDLGTTNSLVAVWMEEGPVIIPNVFGKNLSHFEGILNSQNEFEIRKEVARLTDILDKLEGIKDDSEE
jgi:molecular chaperone DnaK (HSP70)